MHITPRDHIFGLGLANYAHLVQRTARLQVQGREHMEQARASGRPVILAGWHGMTMMISAYVFAYEDSSSYVGVIPDDDRGATLSIWARHMRIATFPVSMEETSLVAARRLLALIRELERGKTLYINPDGPAGPSHEPKKGVFFIAHKADALIVPIGAYTDACIRIPRWDRYTVPLPFSRIAISLGQPLEIDAADDSETSTAILCARLDAAEQAAEEFYRHGRRDG